MKYADWMSARSSARACAVAMVLATTLSGCSMGRWFETGHPQANPAPAPMNSSDDLKASAVTYIRNLCALPREQRESQVRGLNEGLLPNHAVISCGRGGTPGE